MAQHATLVVRGVVPAKLKPDYQKLLAAGYRPTDVALEGIRSLSRHIEREQR